ncbi:hypothetical protein RvY_00375 [Ramazzottius varieornatus]|uniref:Uncharacterized protein n=1 Tax=Ramazzottius varieornatus TaxID=947166 RepID=A0A1D1UGN1_RAMVA|nr:hypothetical protein RvY_00375 [Ramazzottius varieornatus]
MGKGETETYPCFERFQPLQPVTFDVQEYRIHRQLLCIGQEDAFFLELGGDLLDTMPEDLKQSRVRKLTGEKRDSRAGKAQPTMLQKLRKKFSRKSSLLFGGQKTQLASVASTSHQEEKPVEEPSSQVATKQKRRSLSAELESLRDSLTPKFQTDSPCRTRKQSGHYRMMAAGVVNDGEKVGAKKNSVKEDKRMAANEKRRLKRLQDKQLKDSNKANQNLSRSTKKTSKTAVLSNGGANPRPETADGSQKVEETLTSQAEPATMDVLADWATISGGAQEISIPDIAAGGSLQILALDSPLSLIDVFKQTSPTGSPLEEVRVRSADGRYFTALSPTATPSTSYSGSFFTAQKDPASPNADVFDLQTQTGTRNFDYLMRELSGKSVRHLGCSPPGDVAVVLDHYLKSLPSAPQSFLNHSGPDYESGLDSSYSLEMDDSVMEDALSLLADSV